MVQGKALHDGTRNNYFVVLRPKVFRGDW